MTKEQALAIIADVINISIKAGNHIQASIPIIQEAFMTIQNELNKQSDEHTAKNKD